MIYFQRYPSISTHGFNRNWCIYLDSIRIELLNKELYFTLKDIPT